MIWYLLIGVVIGFLLGKLDAIRNLWRFRKSLLPEDRTYVDKLIHLYRHPEDRWKEHAEHDIWMSRNQRY